MEASMEAKTYRSPIKKLLGFFVRSRDGWKQKCQGAKVRIRRLSSRLQKLKVSRNRWKERAVALCGELAQVHGELDRLKIGG
jgi:hypothetical protein